MKRIIPVLGLLLLTGCTSGTSTESTTATSDTESDSTSQTTTQTSYGEGSSIEFTERDLDSSYDESTATVIVLADGGTTISGEGASVAGDVITISAEGTYILSGSLSNGQIVIDATSEDKIQVVLDEVDITSESSAPIYIKQADKVFLTIIGDNNLETSGDYVAIDDNNVDGVIYSKDDLTINGTGTLIVEGDSNGIVSKDDLILVDVTINMNVGNHGLEANDIIKVKSGSYNITSGDDAINSSNDEDGSLGNIYICGGEFDLDSGDDALHATATITIDGGELLMSAEDDGIHSDTEIIINSGSILIEESYEGIEAADITINGGSIELTSSDDGFNVSGGNDSSGFGGGMDQFASSSGVLTINDGVIYVNASGDGLDSNGDLIINGGEVYASGPTNSGNGVIDYNGEGSITGGTIIAVGASGMDQTLTATNQGVVYMQLSQNYQSGSKIEITDSDGNVLASYTATSAFNMIVFSTSELSIGNTYTLTISGDSTTITLDTLQYGSSAGTMKMPDGNISGRPSRH